MGNTASSPYKVHECSKCQRDAEYYCESCSYDLCLLCKENHIHDLNSTRHYIIRRNKINYIPQEICVRHRSKVYTKYCEPCQVPVCNKCQTHRKHKKINVKTAYKTKRQQHRGTIHTIRSDALFYRPILLTEIKAEVITCHEKLSPHQSAMLTKAQTLKNIIDFMLYDLLNNVFCDFNFNHRCFNQKIDLIGHIVSLQRFVHIYEQRRVIRPLKFLFSIKTALPQIHLTLHTSQLSMSESLNKENVMESLSAIEITERGNRRAGRMLKLTGVNGCDHMSFVTSDLVWVSDGNNLILTKTTNTTVVPLHRVEDSCRDYYDGHGSHTVNSESELIYIDRNDNINKLSKDLKITTTLIEKTDSIWEPRSVYWSPSTGDVLVGKYNSKKRTGKVTRYNPSGQLIHTIQYNNRWPLYDGPDYITENNNGDVVVCDRAYESDYMFGHVVVTERGGKYRFTYGGDSSGLRPFGICTDALSHILVCDYITDTVQMLDKDGQFLAHLAINSPWGLSYDVNTHRLWAGYRCNTVLVFKYITRQDALAEEHTPCSDKDPMFSSTPAVEWISTYPPPYSG